MSHKMSLTFIEQVKLILSRDKMTITDLAKLLGTSRQNLHNKFERDSLNTKDMQKIADALGCELEIALIKKKPLKSMIPEIPQEDDAEHNSEFDEEETEYSEETKILMSKHPRLENEGEFDYLQRLFKLDKN